MMIRVHAFLHIPLTPACATNRREAEAKHRFGRFEHDLPLQKRELENVHFCLVGGLEYYPQRALSLSVMELKVRLLVEAWLLSPLRIRGLGTAGCVADTPALVARL